MLLKQSYSYTGSIKYTFSVDYSQSGTSLISEKAGIGGIDFMPSDGDTVAVFSNVIGTAGDFDFKPGLNNKLYYLVSDDLTVDRDTIISQGTAITVALVSGSYVGSFVFSNPNGFEYLYLVSDYTNNLASSGDVLSYAYPNGATEFIDTVLDNNAGVVAIEYNASTGPFRVAIEYNGEIIADTGVIAGPVINTLEFVKTSHTSDAARVIVNNRGPLNTIIIKSPVTALTGFYIDSTAGTLGTVCGQQATELVYHNGSSSLPVAGDIIYYDSSGDDVFDGENSYHVISTVSMGAPSASSVYAAVLSDGVVSTTGTCVCSEVAIPVITQTDITVKQGQEFSVYVQVTNNPNSWELVTTCEEYTLEGGIKGAVFSYTDCDSIVQRSTVSSNQTLNVCASIAPTVVTGTGVVTLVGTCQEKSLPGGVEFKDGIIFGKPVTSGRTEIELVATNCFGDSLSVAFDIIVESAIDLTPVAIDVSVVSDTELVACAIAPGSFSLLYHNGSAVLPALNDTIYTDQSAIDPFVGGSLWYLVDATVPYSIQIDELGVIIDIHTC